MFPMILKNVVKCIWMILVRSLTEGRLINLKEVLKKNGFEVYKEEIWDIFSYIEARKK